MHGRRSVALGIKLEIFRNLVRADIANNLRSNLEIVRQLLQLVFNLSVVSMREERYIIGSCSNAGSLGETKWT